MTKDEKQDVVEEFAGTIKDHFISKNDDLVREFCYNDIIDEIEWLTKVEVEKYEHQTKAG